MNAWRPGVKQKFQILENFSDMIFFTTYNLIPKT